MGDKVTVMMKRQWSKETREAVLAVAELAAQKFKDDSKEGAE